MDQVKEQLAREKPCFLDDVEREIKTEIKSRGKNCIGINQMKSDGTVYYTWELGKNDIDDFGKVLYHFLKDKQPTYKGYALDSALSGPISDIVIKRWTQVFVDQSEAISKGVIETLVADEVKLKTFVTRVSEVALASVSKSVQNKIIDKIVDQIKDSVQHGTLHAMGQSISLFAATAAGGAVVTTITHLLMKLMVMHGSQIVAKILASSFLSHLVSALAKKFLGAAVLAAFTQYLWIHFGVIITSSTIILFALPLIAAYILYKIATFPEKLGEEVSKNVRAELAMKYESINQTVLERVWASIIDGSDLVDSIKNDGEFGQALKEMAKEEEKKL